MCQYCTLNNLQYSVSITFICTGKPKSWFDKLYCDLCVIAVAGTDLAISPRYACIINYLVIALAVYLSWAVAIIKLTLMIKGSILLLDLGDAVQYSRLNVVMCRRRATWAHPSCWLWFLDEKQNKTKKKTHPKTPVRKTVYRGHLEIHCHRQYHKMGII